MEKYFGIFKNEITGEEKIIFMYGVDDDFMEGQFKEMFEREFVKLIAFGRKWR